WTAAMSEVTFRDLSVLWVAIPLCVVALLWQWRRRRTYLAFSRADWMRPLLNTPSTLRRLPAIIAAGGLALLVMALMDPVVPYSESQVSARGLDIVLVVDL